MAQVRTKDSLSRLPGKGQAGRTRRADGGGETGPPRRRSSPSSTSLSTVTRSATGVAVTARSSCCSTGSPAARRTWVPAMRLLQSDYTVLAPDFLGHGESAKPLGDYSLGNLASAIRDLLDLLGIDRATVVGQSFGGGVALQFAYQFPEHCERLVLVDAGGLGREVNWILRLLTLPGVEYVLPVLFPGFVRTGGIRSPGFSATGASATPGRWRCGAPTSR